MVDRPSGTATHTLHPTFYHANREEIEADIAAEEAEAKQLETRHALQRNPM